MIVAGERFYNIKDAATKLGVNYTSFRSWLQTGAVKKPTRVIGIRKYYSEEDLKTLIVEK